MITPFMHLATAEGDVKIRAEDLSLVRAADLKKFRITRAELRRCFAEAMELMKGATQEDWARRRPVCVETLEQMGSAWSHWLQPRIPLMDNDYDGPQGTA